MKYQVIKDENELQNQINSLEKMANTYLLEINELYMEDLFFMSVIDKSIKLIDCFLFALDKRNITILATLTRVQMDCAMRAFATTLVKDSGEFCKAILINNERIDKLQDIRKNKIIEQMKVLQKHYKNIKNILQCDKSIYKREVLLYKYSVSKIRRRL